MQTNRHLIISGTVFTVVIFCWPVFMALAQPGGNTEEQFRWISAHLALFKVQFLFALLIGPAIVYMMVSQLDRYPASGKIASALGSVFLTAYIVLISISYASQIVILPGLIGSGFTEQAHVWYFNSPVSVVYFLNQMGYCFWGIGAMVLFTRLIKQRGIIRYISLIYILSGILSVTALFGLMVESKAINSLTLYGGLVLVPVGILTVITGIKDR
jgi:hypothetical protein